MTQPVGSEKFNNDDSIPSVNWEVVVKGCNLPKSTRVNSGEIPVRSYILLVAAAATANDSLAQKTKSLLNAQVRRWEGDWLKDIAVYANMRGLSIEDAIIELVNSLTNSQ